MVGLVNVLVTGSEGLVGSAYKKFSPNEVVPYDLALGQDVRNADQLLKVAEENKIEAIVHLAALETDRFEAYSVNAMSAFNIFALHHDSNHIPVVFATSQYALLQWGTYGHSKYLMERIVQEMPWKENASVWVLRFGSVYDERGGRGVLAKALQHGENPTAPFRVTRGAYRNFTHVEDVCAAIDIALSMSVEKPPGFAEVIDRPVLVSDVIDRLGIPSKEVEGEGDDWLPWLPMGVSSRLMNWEPKHDVLKWAETAIWSAKHGRD